MLPYNPNITLITTWNVKKALAQIAVDSPYREVRYLTEKLSRAIGRDVRAEMLATLSYVITRVPLASEDIPIIDEIKSSIWNFVRTTFLVEDENPPVVQDNVRCIGWPTPFFIHHPRVAIAGMQNVETLSGISQMVDCIGLTLLDGPQIKRGVLDLLRIPSLTTLAIDTKPERWLDIVRTFLPSKDILACQEALIDAGLEDFAEL